MCLDTFHKDSGFPEHVIHESHVSTSSAGVPTSLALMLFSQWFLLRRCLTCSSDAGSRDGWALNEDKIQRPSTQGIF